MDRELNNNKKVKDYSSFELFELSQKYDLLKDRENELNKKLHSQLLENSKLLEKNKELSVLYNSSKKFIKDNFNEKHCINNKFNMLVICNNECCNFSLNLENSTNNKLYDNNNNNNEYNNDNINIIFDSDKIKKDLIYDFIEYDKDTITLKKSTSILEEKLTNILKHSKQWIDSVDMLKKSLENVVEKLNATAECFTAGLSFYEDSADALQILYAINNISTDVSNQLKLLVNNIDNTFIFPLKSLINFNYRSLNELNNLISKHSEEYYSISSKYLNTCINSNANNNIKKANNKEILKENYFSVKKLYELSRFDYISKLNEIVIISKVDIPEKLCLLFINTSSTINLINDIYSKMKPTINYNLDKIIFKQNIVVDIKQKFKKQKNFILEKGVIPRFSFNNLSNYYTNKSKKDNSNSSLNCQQDKIHKEGYLNIKLLNKGYNEVFKKRYFKILDNGNLIYYKIKNDVVLEDKEIILCKLLLCTVKYHEKEYDYPFCFEILNATDKKSYLLQSDSDIEAEDWFVTIRNAISNTICTYEDKDTKITNSTSEKNNYNNLKSFNAHNYTNNNKYKKNIENLISFNKCADCDSDFPTWISTNWITLICIDCSGIHRSLGVNYSKIKSLRLDKIELELIDILEYLEGHNQINKILESKLSKINNRKPNKLSSIKEKEAYIVDKYKRNAFLDYKKIDNIVLKDAILNNNLLEIYEYLKSEIFIGNDIYNINLKIDNKTINNKLINENLSDTTTYFPLVHYVCYYSKVLVLKLLICFGFNTNEYDCNNMKPIDYATLSNNVRLYLINNNYNNIVRNC